MCASSASATISRPTSGGCWRRPRSSRCTTTSSRWSSPSITARRQEIARAAQRLAIEVAAGRLPAAAHHRGSHRRPSRCAGPARSRSHHPHQRRAAALELPALAGRLQRACLRSDLLAGLRPLHARRRHRRISPSRTTVWRTDRTNRFMIMSDADPARPMHAAGSRRRSGVARRLGACAGAAGDRRLPISAAGSLPRSGESPRIVVMWEWTDAGGGRRPAVGADDRRSCGCAGGRAGSEQRRRRPTACGDLRLRRRRSCW